MIAATPRDPETTNTTLTTERFRGPIYGYIVMRDQTYLCAKVFVYDTQLSGTYAIDWGRE